MKDTFTTGEIAKYCQVTHRAVLQWVEKGKLKAYRTPGRHSRVKRQDFIEFLQEYEMPVPKELSSNKGKVKKILVVDDDKTTVRLIKGILEKQDYDISVAHNGFSAGLKFSTFGPDLITLDLKMPQLDGFEVLKIIRSYQHNKDVKIIVISDYLNEETKKIVLDLGADDCLKKPIDRQRFNTKIKELLKEQSSLVS